MNTFFRNIVGFFIPAKKNLGSCHNVDFYDHSISYLFARSFYGDITTSIIIENQIFLKLNGDHRKSLLKISEHHGLDGCIKYFAANIDQANMTGDHYDVIDPVADSLGIKIQAIALRTIGEEGINRIRIAYNKHIEKEDFKAA